MPGAAPPSIGQEFASFGSGIGSAGSGAAGIVDALSGIFGTSASQNTSSRVKGSVTEKLNIDPAGVEKILQDILGGEQGLASIFSGEQTSGIYSSSVAAQASGDLLTKLAGEIAKLTAEKTTATDTTTSTKQKSGTGGLIKNLF